MLEFNVARSIVVVADPPRIHALINDLHHWQQWSPWEGADTGIRREFAGPLCGVGARYAWQGNKFAGRGTMEIIGSKPDSIVVSLRFRKPFRATNRDLHPDPGRRRNRGDVAHER